MISSPFPFSVFSPKLYSYCFWLKVACNLLSSQCIFVFSGNVLCNVSFFPFFFCSIKLFEWRSDIKLESDVKIKLQLIELWPEVHPFIDLKQYSICKIGLGISWIDSVNYVVQRTVNGKVQNFNCLYSKAKSKVDKQNLRV